MQRSRDGDVTEVAGAVKVIELTWTDPRVWDVVTVFMFLSFFSSAFSHGISITSYLAY